MTDPAIVAGPGYREPPANLEAEQALLAAILLNNAAADKVEFLSPEHFHEPVHGRIYEAARKLISRGQIASPVTLKAYFEHDDALEEVGGAQYLAKLAASAVTVVNAGDYGHVIHDLAIRRLLITSGRDLIEAAMDPDLDTPAAQVLEGHEQELYRIAGDRPDKGAVDFAKALTGAVDFAQAAYKRPGGLAGLATGLKALDERLGGLCDADLIILAGRPAMGKTALAMTIAQNAARGEGAKTVAFFSLEMAAEQLALRALAAAADVNLVSLRRGDTTEAEFLRIVAASQELGSIPLRIDDMAALSMPQITTRARRLKRTHGLGLIIVDYLQLIHTVKRRSQDNRVQEISEISQGLKALAKELAVPVLALSQLSRAVESREDKRPQLSDLRDSGAIEQDADVVMFVYREEHYLERKEPRPGTDEHVEWEANMGQCRGTAEIIVAKHRQGPTGTARLAFRAKAAAFSNLETRS